MTSTETISIENWTNDSQTVIAYIESEEILDSNILNLTQEDENNNFLISDQDWYIIPAEYMYIMDVEQYSREFIFLSYRRYRWICKRPVY
jgi:hypothetical protein